MSARELITEHLDLWTGAVTKKSSSGRGSNGKVELTGIKKLRKLILELAVRGKLVEQDAGDEPAQELIAKLSAAKTELIREGMLKKSRKLPDISDEEALTPLPSGWVLTRLGDAYDVRDGTHDSPKYQPSGYPLITSKNLSSGELSFEDVKLISESDHKKIQERSEVRKGDILFAMIGSIGNPVVVNTDKEFSIKNVALFKYYSNNLSSPSFLKLFLEHAAENLKQQAAGGVQSFVSLGKLRSWLIPLPPLAEQHRIVQKVDELMALCDRLEQQTSDQLEAHETLVDTLLSTLTQSKNATELADNWTRLAAHFDTLFTTEQSIEKLKQTILQLAVMGRLVEQDLADESAEKMLGQLAKVKRELIAQGLLKKERKNQPVDSKVTPYEIPDNWSWCSLTDIGELARGKSKHRPRNDPSLYQDGTVPLIQTGDVARASPWITTFSAKYNLKGVEQSRVWKSGTLCITIAANIGDTGLLSFDACFPDSVVGFIPFRSEMQPEYFEYFLRTAKRHLEDFAPSTAQKNINLDVLQKLLVPLPPVAEMVRIVKRVDKLMALCDQLKERLNRANETRAQLAGAVIEDALSH